MTLNNIIFPIRINAYLAHTGVCTRKQADVYVSQGKVLLNKKRAVLGAIVQKGDVVELINVEAQEFIYALWNKPRGTSTPDSKVIVAHGTNVKTHCIGRLDKDTDGLILLSNDTRLSERLLNPKYNHEKEYEVFVRENIVPAQLKQLMTGVRITHDGKRLTVKAKAAEKTEQHILSITLTEGKKHQVRQMCSAVHLTVTHLRRVRIQNLKLKKLRADAIELLRPSDTKELLNSIGL